MNMTGTFADDFARSRPVAQHCTELTWRGPRPDERKGAVTAWIRDLSSDMAQELGQILQGDKLDVTISEPKIMTGAEVFEKIGPIAINTLLRIGSGDQTVLLSLDYATAVALTDCSFGGEGAKPEKGPSELPRSAGLLVEQFAATMAQVIAMAQGTGEPARGDVLVRSESVVRLKPFSTEAEISVMEVSLAQGGSAEWEMLLALPHERLDELLPKTNSNRSLSCPEILGSKRGDAYAGLPLVLEAVLSEIEMPIGKLERLAPGDEIALNIPRELPLRIGDDVFAHGVVGTFDNHMALRLTSVSHSAVRSDQGAARARFRGAA
ncbi:flagellar motor switch protein FliM [uncultured Erythrobacter sp.]|uniref:flagellar motor switch protein FliM n=1 Tax=uncultured Erythrobacter sp. TaxID=263913 RepID=UPI00261B56E6|nr:flagellar motor switch protein FliM [uncultured Erythrobacter sp.]